MQCAWCGHIYQDELGKYGCPNCLAEGLDEPMLVTTQYDHSKGKWRFTLERIKHDIPDWPSDYKYTTDIDAYQAGKDAIDFDLHYRLMEKVT